MAIHAGGIDMRRPWTTLLPLIGLCVLPGAAAAQAQQEVPASNVITRSVTAIGYPVGKSTKVDLKGTDLMPQGDGEARVQAHTGATKVEAQIENMAPPSRIGTEFLTYVLWA